MVNKEIIELVRKYLLKIDIEYKEAWIFGSYAKGNFHKDSDLDIAIIVDDSQNTYEIDFQLLKIREESELIIEPHCIVETEFNKYNSLSNEILKNGFKVN